MAAGEGYEITSDYSSGTFNLVDTESDIPQGVISEPNQTIPTAVDTRISADNPSFSTTEDVYFDIGNRYLNEDGTYTYTDYSEDVDVYEVELNAGDTVTLETSDFETNLDQFNRGLSLNTMVFDAEGNRLRDYDASVWQAAPDKLFGGVSFFAENETDSYQEFTAPEDGAYYFAYGNYESVLTYEYQQDFRRPLYDPFTPNTGNGNRSNFGDYAIEIDLLTEENPRSTGTPTAPVSNPDVTNPPTLSLIASPATVDSEGNFTNAVVEHLEESGEVSSVTFTIETEGEIPEGGIEVVLNSNANLFDYVSLEGQNSLPETIGGQSLGAFYNESGIPTGIRLLIEEPTMTVNYEAASTSEADFFQRLYGNVLEKFEPLETDGAEDVTFFLQSGEGYEIAPDTGETEITYYDSLADVPASTGGVDTVPEVGVTASETELIETEGTETTLTFNLSETPPEEGITVYLDSEEDPLIGSALSQFDVLDAEISGGDFPVANGDTSGFFFNITEQTASITLPVFDELAIDTANGLIGQLNADLAEDVDFFSFNLEAGQTVSLDIDTEEILPNTTNSRPVVYPALSDNLQKPDTELRLFDAEGNELAANNDGAADDEAYSRDPFVEYTAESAGTYYVDVSQLGNDNYDPFVERSGSGWTFPEVGVNFGDYELTASIEDGTTEPSDPTDPEQPTEPEAPTTEPLFGSLEADTIEVEGSDQLIFAGEEDDLIDATIGEGKNRIYGGDGDDILISGSNNRIFGEEGSDRFLNGAFAPASRRDFALRRSAVSLMGQRACPHVTPKTRRLFCKSILSKNATCAASLFLYCWR